MFSETPIVRRKSRQIMVGNVPVGGDAPISVQSMTNTSTGDVAATVAQIKRIQLAGADIVRVSVPSLEEAEAFGQIRKLVDVPLVADIHFDHNIALRVADLGVDCLRINPGNITREDRLREVIAKARDLNIPIRIGVNAGSLGKDLLRKSLAADPVEEAKVAWDMLRSLRLRSKGINFIACPSCSRQEFDVIKTVNELESRLEDITVPMDVSIIGCIVNGPGEAKESDFGLTGGSPANLVYVDGVPNHKVGNENLVDELESQIRAKAAAKEIQLAKDADNLIAKA